MKNHTPGPWTYWGDRGYGDIRFYVTQSNEAPFTAGYSDVGSIVFQTTSGEREAVQEANARLISSSPCLLKAAKKALSYFEAVGELNSDEAAELSHAINKAEGNR